MNIRTALGKPGSMLVVFFTCMVTFSACALIRSRFDRIRPPSFMSEVQAFSRNDSLTGSLGPFRSCYDVTFYNLDIEVDIENREVRGVVGISFTVMEDTDSLQVDLYRNMDVYKIVFENKNVLYRREHNSIFLDVRRLHRGEKGTVWITYGGKPIVATNAPWSGGFVWKKDNNNFDYIGLTTEMLGPSFWWPNKDHPSDEADSVSIRITAPTELTCVSNGRLLHHFPLDDKRSCWHWYVKNPINTANVTLNVGNYVHFSDTLHALSGAQALHYYVLPQNFGKAKKHFEQTKQILHCFEDLFGSYPWWADGYKIVEAPFIGMDHQSAIAYGNGFSNEHNYSTFGVVDYILLHETAHEWWGNSITACDAAEQWLHEGFATYSEALYIERVSGRQRFLAYLREDMKGIRNRNPMIGPSEVGWNQSDGDIYIKGSWVLHSLRGVINNDSIFFSILHDFATTYAHQVVCTDDFIAMVEDKTGQDYTSFFQQYLYKSDPPALEYCFSEEKIYYRWVNTDAGFFMPVDIIVNLKPVRVLPGASVRELYVGRATKVAPDLNRFYLDPIYNPELANLFVTEQHGGSPGQGQIRRKLGRK